MNKILSLGKNFFSNEKRAYSNWKEAILKEIAQNGLDSVGCTRMDFTFIKGEETTKIIAKDNGAGMTREVLENVFLVLGESKKEGNNPIGGFGVARQLITFANDSYIIKSFDYVCKGSGAMYEIEESDEFVKGCVFEIETEHHDWETELKNLLNKSSINAAIYINGVKYQNTLRRGRMVRNLSFGEVYVNKSAPSGLYVRVNGLLMFSKYVSCAAQVCVEINPAQSKEVLTSNRYGLQYKESDELQNFLNELSADTKSALKDKTKHFKKFVNKENCFKSRPKAIPVGTELVGDENPRGQEQVRQVRGIGADEIKNSILSFGANPIDRESLLVYQTDPILSSMMILNESENIKTIQLIKSFYMPEKWENRDATRYQLIRQWFEVCRIVMDELSNMVQKEFSFAVGWVFGDEQDGETTGAKHLLDENIHYLLLNPITSDLKLKYSVNSKDDFFNLIVLACHEATHAMPDCQWHNETFASIMTTLTQRALNRRKEIIDAMKGAK